MLHLLFQVNGKSENKVNESEEFIQKITRQFNDSIVFEPDLLKMSYTIRDPIINSKLNYCMLYVLTCVYVCIDLARQLLPEAARRPTR